eukprot:858899_1
MPASQLTTPSQSHEGGLQTFKKANTKTLSFSEMSTMKLFMEDDRYTQMKSYSAADKKKFTQNAIGEALRIRKLLHESIKNESKLPLAAQLEANGVSQESIIGLERLILEDPVNACKRRRNHARLVLMEQTYQKMEGRNDICRLAQLSIKLAKRPTFEARKRAARAA